MRYWALFFLLATVLSCKKNNESTLTDYTYAGTSVALMEHVLIDSNGVQTIAWDSTYLDKMYVHYDVAGNTVTMTISEQHHACQSFQTVFNFPRNNLNTYTANSATTQASHTFEIGANSINAHMLRYDGTDSNHTQYQLNFQGTLVQ